MRPVWAQWADWAYHWPTLVFDDFLRPFTTLSVHYDAPLGPNVDRWADLKTSTEPTFPVFVSCVGPVGRLGIPLACPIFCGCFVTIHEPFSAMPCPLGPNVDRWAALKTSAEPTFPVFVTCVGPVGRLGIPLASPIFCGCFVTIHEHFSAMPWPLGPNVNSWSSLKTSTEPTFNVFVISVGRLGIPLASPIFRGFFETIHDPLSAIPCPLGPNVNSWDTLAASREPIIPFNATCVGTMGRLGIPLAYPIFC